MKRLVFVVALGILLSGLCDARERPKPSAAQALTVRHIPNPVPVSSVPDSTKNSKMYVWRFRTEVRNNLNVPLRITEFGSYSYSGGKWIQQNAGKKPFSDVDFVKWYTAGDSATGGWIRPGAVAADANNWNSAGGPVPWTRSKWVYTAEDAEGNTYQGESEVELIPYARNVEAWAGVDVSQLVSITGRILDADRRPPEYAQLRLGVIGGGRGEALETSVAGAGGAFSMRVKKPGWYRISVYAPWHDPLEIPLAVREEDRELSVTVMLAPRDYSEKSGAHDLPAVTFAPEESSLQTIWSIDRAMQQGREHSEKAFRRWCATGGRSENFHYDWSSTAALLKTYMKGKGGLTARPYAAFELAQLPRKHDPETAREIIELLPANSSLWSYTRPLVGFVGRSFEAGKQKEIFQTLIRENPDRVVRAQCLEQLAFLARGEGNEEVVRQSYQRLKTEFGNVREIQWALKELDPNKAVALGKPVPSFELKLMDKNETVSDKSLLGRYYLIDFWAVWCGICVHEMKDVHAAYQKYKNRNFAILSVSLDAKREDAVKFRKGKWPMPWMNAYVEGGMKSDLARSFEIVGIPKPILVGPDGKILAIDVQLRGKELEKTLKKHLVGSK